MLRLGRSPFGVLAATLTIVLAVQAQTLSKSEWQNVYVVAADRLISGEDIYQSGTNYLYPPLFALLAVPAAWVPEWASRLLWSCLSIPAMFAAILCAWRIASGPAVNALKASLRGESGAFAAGLVVGLTYFLNAASHQQTDLIIAGLVIGGATLLATGRDAAGAASLALASAAKATPLLWAPYLVWRGRWIASFVVAGGTIALNLLPELVASPPEGGTWTGEWLTRFVLSSQQLNIAAGTWGSAIEYNQSLMGTLQRLISTVPGFMAPNGLVTEWPWLPAQVVRGLGYLLMASAITVSLAASWRSRRAGPSSDDRPGRFAWEFSIVLTLMLLMSPMSSRAHFGILILPAFCLARAWLTTRDRVCAVILAAVVPLTLVANKDPVGAFVYDAFLWVGATTFSAILLWIGCVRALWRTGGHRRS